MAKVCYQDQGVLRWSLLLFSLSLLAVVGSVVYVRQQGPSTAQWLVFESDRAGGNWDLYLMRADGSEVRRLTSDAGIEFNPAWSPGGQWISFLATHNSLSTLFRIRPDGRGLQQLSDSQANTQWPAWSPDGRAMVFNRDGAIVRLDLERGALRQLTGKNTVNREVSWSPDGQWIIYRTVNGNRFELNRMRPDGLASQRITAVSIGNWPLSWSPDGQWVAFVGDEGNNWDIYRVRIDGSDLSRLTWDAADDYDPVWSPDGQWILFTSQRSDGTSPEQNTGEQNLYRVRPNGDDLQRLTRRSGRYWSAQWSPDGQWIAFSASRDEISQLYRMRVDGSDLVNLTGNAGSNTFLAWSPEVEGRLHPNWLVGLSVTTLTAAFGFNRRRARRQAGAFLQAA